MSLFRLSVAEQSLGQDCIYLYAFRKICEDFRSLMSLRKNHYLSWEPAVYHLYHVPEVLLSML